MDRSSRPSPSLIGLRERIESVLSGPPDLDAINGLVRLCHGIARMCIAGKRNSGTLSSYHGLNFDDLAYDCIADLFQRDDHGHCIILKAYFSGLSLDGIQEEDLLIHLRRLVFSRVNQNIFRLYGEIDPGLAKILRNVKLVVHSVNNFLEGERFGEPCIHPELCDTLEHLPSFEFNELIDGMLALARGNEKIPDLLSKFSLMVRDQHEHSRIVPLVTVARLFREVYRRSQQDVAHEEVDEQTRLDNEGMNATIERAIRIVRSKYKSRDTLQNTEGAYLEGYFGAIRKLLVAKLVEHDGKEVSLFRVFSEYVPGLTMLDYTKNYRARIEYLARLVQKETLNQLNK